jgi:hypothetical protein
MQVGKCYLQEQYVTTYETALPPEFPYLRKWETVELLRVTDIRNGNVYCCNAFDDDKTPTYSFIPIKETHNFRYMELDESEITLYLLKVM